VTLSASRPERAAEAAQVTGARAAASNREALEGADVVILAVPTPALDTVLGELGPVVGDRIVIDVTNRVNPADPASVLEPPSNAERIQAGPPSARVVNAFNYAFAARHADPSVDGGPADGFVAGDDEEAKAAVLELVGSIGFRPIDAGPLVTARVLEGMALLHIMLQIKYGWPWQSAIKLIGPTG
jgi:8-hydroxy-5-deazaflavin:NADPH oxidoreductase